jgi:hypothetical protein
MSRIISPVLGIIADLHAVPFARPEKEYRSMRISYMLLLMTIGLAGCIDVHNPPPRTADTVITPAPAPQATVVTPAAPGATIVTHP